MGGGGGPMEALALKKLYVHALGQLTRCYNFLCCHGFHYYDWVELPLPGWLLNDVNNIVIRH